MTLRKAPEKIDIEKLIDKGAKVKADNKAINTREWTNISLRMPTDMIENIDRILHNRVGMSRTGWILEAIQKHLEKEI